MSQTAPACSQGLELPVFLNHPIMCFYFWWTFVFFPPPLALFKLPLDFVSYSISSEDKGFRAILNLSSVFSLHLGPRFHLHISGLHLLQRDFNPKIYNTGWLICAAHLLSPILVLLCGQWHPYPSRHFRQNPSAFIYPLRSITSQLYLLLRCGLSSLLPLSSFRSSLFSL